MPGSRLPDNTEKRASGPRVLLAVEHLVAATEEALGAAEAGDLERLALVVARRDALIHAIGSFGDPGAVTASEREQVIRGLQAARDMEGKIREVLERELATGVRALADTTATSRALLAYERLAPKTRRFDIQK